MYRASDCVYKRQCYCSGYNNMSTEDQWGVNGEEWRGKGGVYVYNDTF